MKPWKKSTPILLLAFLQPLLHAQDGSDLNFVRDWVGYRVIGNFAANPNNIEVFNDYCIDFQEDPSEQDACDNFSPYGLEYDAFLDSLALAYQEGRGGVIDFETPILGPAYRNYDRREHRAFIESYILDNPLEGFEAEVRAEFPEMGDADVLALSTTRQLEAAYAAAEEALLDTSVEIPVVARIDRDRDDTSDNALIEQTIVSDIIGFYGENLLTPLRIRRGPNSYTEGQLATTNFAGPWDLGSMINGEFFTNVGISTYSGGAYRPVSGVNTFNSGMHDLLFDPRDNITALGFVFLTYGNFQFYQGDSGTPVNPNNMRVYVEFSNGETEELAQTSRQSSGNWDIFFGIQAPEGASITRLQLRVIGRNWRTFAAIDDLAFITEPSLPYVVGDTAFTGSQGADFYEILLTGQNPESVTIENLPEGLSFDAESRLISGTFAEAGTFTSTVIFSNAVGTAEETLTFEVAPAQTPVLELDELEPVNVVLRRDLPPVTITSNLDDELPLGSIAYFTLVEKILEDGTRVPSSLDFLGLTLRDNTIFGTPGAAQQIGTYEIRVFGRTATSADSTSFLLTVLAPTLSPNFDSNKTSDFAFVSGNELWTAVNSERPGDFEVPVLERRVSGLPAGAELFTGDVNGDNQTDLITWDAAAGRVSAYLATGANGGFTDTTLLSGIDSASGEEIVAIQDYDGDGTADIFWTNRTRNRVSIWLMRNGAIAWAGLLEKPEGIGELLLQGDFAGDGSIMHLYRKEAGSYVLEQYDGYTTLGEIQYTAVPFTMDPRWEPVLATDFTNDGKADILWQDNRTGEGMLWEMDGTATATAYFSEAEDGALTGVAQTRLFPKGFNWSVVAAADVNNDQFADLVLRNRDTRQLGLLLMRVNQSVGSIRILGDFHYELLAAGDYDGDARNDLLLLDTAVNELEVVSIDDEGTLSGTPFAANPDSATWLSGVAVTNETAGLDVGYDWLGPYTFINNVWMHVQHLGYVAPVGLDEETRSVWFLDSRLGYLWTSEAVYPNLIFQPRNGYYLQFIPGPQPRQFYNYLFGFVMTEDML